MRKNNALAISLIFLMSSYVSAQEVQFIGTGGDFSITTMIRRVTIHMNGVEVFFDKREGSNRWPDQTTPGWSGPLQYSLGLVLKINGHWFASAPIETWFGNNVIGGPIQNIGQIPNNWFYDVRRWGPLAGYQPAIGESVGVYVVAGDVRNAYHIVNERSNIVFFPLPAPLTTASFEFDSPTPIPTPTPTPTPEEVLIKVQLDRMELKIDTISTSLEEHRAASKNLLKTVTDFIRDPRTIAAIGGILSGIFIVP